MIDYTLARSRRRTVAIYIRDGAVEVRAPLRTAKRDIDAFVASKERWIAGKLAQSREQLRRRGEFALNYGGAVTLRGVEYALTASGDGARADTDNPFTLPPELTPEQIRSEVVQIYRECAKRHLTERVAHFAGVMNAEPSAVKISGAKTRWGSCSGKKSLNFSWRLILADDGAIDYVVVHELAHLTEMNHSARFWRLVAGVLPDYRARQARLRALQRKLGGEDY
ncbi:MAG: M48 family metallopeptidase [Oscillospiraceae bacterium]|jgi:predicted metal-dependent hydrolase|nr:M48 family metallopeptidase [Oscillospiraceae bacterium]